MISVVAQSSQSAVHHNLEAGKTVSITRSLPAGRGAAAGSAAAWRQELEAGGGLL